MASKAIGFLNFKFSADLSAFERAMKKANKSLTKFGKKWSRVGKDLTRNVTLPILAVGAASVKAFDVQAKAETRLLTALKGREDIQKRLIKQAAEFQKLTLFADEEIISQQAYLAALGMTEDQINKVLKASMDLAVGTGQTLEFGVKNLAKTFGGLTGELGESLPMLKELTKEQLMAGEAVDMVAEAFEGQAEAARSADTGLTALYNQLGDLGEQIGSRLLPYVQKFTDYMSNLIKKFDGLSIAQQDSIVKWGLIAAAIGPVVFIVGQLAKALTYIMTPIGLVITAVGSLTAAFIYLKKSASDVAVSIRNSFKSSANQVITSYNTMIAQSNLFLNTRLKLIDLYELEEKGADKSGKKTSYWSNFRTRLAEKFNKALEEQNREKEKSSKLDDKIITSTVKYTQKLDPLVKNIKEYSEISKKLWFDKGLQEGPKNMLNWTEKLTEAQKAHNATVSLLEDVMFSAAMSAVDSQQSFFTAFLDNIKKAIKQLLVQLAVLTVISLLLGGPTMTISKAFSIAKGKVLGLEGFADGGLVYGPTTALIGEGVGTTASNPEVVAPLDKLKQYMGGGNQNIIVEGVLKGNDIYLSNRNTAHNRLRTT